MKIINLDITENGTHIYTIFHNNVVSVISFSKNGNMDIIGVYQ